jgi:hypothetical protein
MRNYGNRSCISGPRTGKVQAWIWPLSPMRRLLLGPSPWLAGRPAKTETPRPRVSCARYRRQTTGRNAARPLRPPPAGLSYLSTQPGTRRPSPPGQAGQTPRPERGARKGQPSSTGLAGPRQERMKARRHGPRGVGSTLAPDRGTAVHWPLLGQACAGYLSADRTPWQAGQCSYAGAVPRLLERTAQASRISYVPLPARPRTLPAAAARPGRLVSRLSSGWPTYPHSDRCRPGSLPKWR